MLSERDVKPHMIKAFCCLNNLVACECLSAWSWAKRQLDPQTFQQLGCFESKGYLELGDFDLPNWNLPRWDMPVQELEHPWLQAALFAVELEVGI
jgi:hypothetical protein